MNNNLTPTNQVQTRQAATSKTPSTTQKPDNAVVKLLWLAIRDIEDKRARERIKNQGKNVENHKGSDRLVEGTSVMGWNAALGALAIAYPDRLNSYL